MYSFLLSVFCLDLLCYRAFVFLSTGFIAEHLSNLESAINDRIESRLRILER